MKTALIVLLVFAAADLLLCAIVLVVVWLEYRRQRILAAATGEPVPRAAGQFGCLVAFAIIGLLAVYGSVWMLVS